MGLNKTLAPIYEWTHEKPDSEVRTLLTKLRRAEDVCRVAVMPDVHLSRQVCVGCVIATKNTIYPAAVGSDIGCGMAAVCLNASKDLIDNVEVARSIFRELGYTNPIMYGLGLKDVPSTSLSCSKLENKKKLAIKQLGTLGRGNHFLEIQADEEDVLWLMVHSGSRGIGQAIYTHHSELARRRPGGLSGFDANTVQGQDYLNDMRWALAYAKKNRATLLESALSVLKDLLGVVHDEDSLFDCFHNYVELETVADEQYYVHRKGAISARLGERGIIPGSMGSQSYHVEGRGNEDSLYSSSHGAGRCMDRTSARRNISLEMLQEEMRGVWYESHIASRFRDEAPSAYKDITKVMKAQRDLTRVVRCLKPVLVYKAG